MASTLKTLSFSQKLQRVLVKPLSLIILLSMAIGGIKVKNLPAGQWMNAGPNGNFGKDFLIELKALLGNNTRPAKKNYFLITAIRF